MSRRVKLIIYTFFAFIVGFSLFIYRITRTSQHLLAKEVVDIYEANFKQAPLLLQADIVQVNKRYFDNTLQAIPQWDNFTLTGAQVIKNKKQEPILLLWYRNNSYQSPLLTLVYQNKTLQNYIVKKYKKGNTEFITYKDYEMPIFTRQNCTYVAICAFNTQTNLYGAIDLNREKDWQIALKSLQWADM